MLRRLEGSGEDGKVQKVFPGKDYLFIIILRNLEPLGKQCSSFPLDYTRKSFTLTIVTFALNF